MPNSPRVALFSDSINSYGRGLLYGVARYIREHYPWDLYVIMGTAEDPSRLKGWDGDGLIARMRSEAVIRHVQTLDCAKVLFDWEPHSPLFPMTKAAGILHQHHHAAKLAFDYFRNRGYQHFAFVRYIDDRRGGHLLDGPFSKLVEAEGMACAIYHPTDPTLLEADHRVTQEDLAKWLSDLPTPLAVWAANDLRGLDVLEACRLCDLRVPEDVAVLGHNNDVLVCELCNPQLSSVALPYEQMGYEAAALLDQIMAQGSVTSNQVLYPATRVVTRRSTDIVAVNDPDLANALQFIRLNAVKGIQVPDVASAVKLSRSTLQRRFTQYLKRTPADEISRVRIERAKELLVNTQWQMPKIAEHCGYDNASRLAEAFNRVVKMAPTTYRKRHQIRSDDVN
ncbi:MAG TPA: XylR family transcriptional regulator [Phycisphaerales bacterium]|nr:XylR family transcriptional regulator [Phycisphaerales bacterium]HCD32542.1 XylR family transcriptional regulator [Phycisphaerales bacterium]|tara:strand:- start:100 stop:1284 length:1185 start_codon:yes stop_codon:yes gene_type:complete